MGMRQDISYLLLKHMIEKDNFTQKQMHDLLTLLDSDIQHYYVKKIEEQTQQYTKTIHALEQALHEQKTLNHQLEVTLQEKELRTLEAQKKAEMVENENKMLKHQLDEMDYVTRKTLEHIKTNIYVGQDVVNTLKDPLPPANFEKRNIRMIGDDESFKEG